VSSGRVIVPSALRRRCWVACVVGIVLGAGGCGGGNRHRATTTSRAPGGVTAARGQGNDGLRGAVGYAAYEGCPSCSGAVPAGLRRPLHLPRVAEGAGCPVSRSRSLGGFVGPGLGDGPIYPVGLDAGGVLHFRYAPPSSGTNLFGGSRWGGQKVLWVGAASYRGPVLIRGRELDGPRVVGFGPDRVPVAEMQLLAAGASSSGEPEGWREWPSFTRLLAGGCYAYQVDGTSFSSVIVFRAVPSSVFR